MTVHIDLGTIVSTLAAIALQYIAGRVLEAADRRIQTARVRVVRHCREAITARVGEHKCREVS